MTVQKASPASTIFYVPVGVLDMLVFPYERFSFRISVYSHKLSHALNQRIRLFPAMNVKNMANWTCKIQEWLNIMSS
ncbi:hypothetical protein [Peribacillus simplex]|uniref:hypothetical protein n=1 Tax=Peribacillus simplex TaxID=1478 RepID=UPI003D2669F0